MESFARPILTVVLDVAAFGADPGARALSLFAVGADWIQLRDRAVEDVTLLDAARAIVSARDEARAIRSPCETRACVIVNKRADIAFATGADGVHLGFDAVEAGDARRILGRGALIGRSLHSVDEVADAAKNEDAIDYVHLAPIWNPNSKPATRPALGTVRLGEACRAGLPVFAQGGIDPTRIDATLRAGAAGVSVTGALATGADPKAVLGPLLDALQAPERPL